jgi:hypothetical protein
MAARRRGLRFACFAFAAATAAWAGFTGPSIAGDDADKKDESGAKTQDDALAKARMALMRDRVAAFRVTAKAGEIPERFEGKPILRYHDPARGYLDAAVWRLGPKGRPRAIITTELYPKLFGQPRISYEFLSLTDAPFQAVSDDYRWAPRGSALTMKPISDAPVPAATDTGRLLQMKQIAKRFTAWEVVEEGRYELRLMPQPIDRYAPGDEDRSDGGVFVYSFGTNPEVALLIESNGKEWSYGLARLTGATSVTARLDESTVWEVGRNVYAETSSYTATNTPAPIPGVEK